MGAEEERIGREEEARRREKARHNDRENTTNTGWWAEISNNWGREWTDACSLTNVKHKNQVQLEIDEYTKKLRWEATKEDTELNSHNVYKYIIVLWWVQVLQQ